MGDGTTEKILARLRVKLYKDGHTDWDVIPQRPDQFAREGPMGLSLSSCKDRNVVEPCIGWLEHNRRLGTRHEKLATRYLRDGQARVHHAGI